MKLVELLLKMKIFTLQKGKPYFFPNCKNEDLINKTNLQYKTISPTRIQPLLKQSRSISLNYYDILKLSVKKKIDFEFLKTKIRY
jgi:hypothetical protein